MRLSGVFRIIKKPLIKKLRPEISNMLRNLKKRVHFYHRDKSIDNVQ